jgi:hypothetical protein
MMDVILIPARAALGLWMRPVLTTPRLLVLAFLFFACEENSPVAPSLEEDLPTSFRLSGTASGSRGQGLTASCSLDLQFELTSEAARTEERADYEGVHGGVVERTLLASDGSGVSFAADVFGNVQVHLFAGGRVEIVIPVNRTAEGRFWQNLASFRGTVDASGRGEGLWVCAPLDIQSGGYVDRSLVMYGVWVMEPYQATGR